MSFGETLRKLRREHNMTQDDLGSKIGTNGRHISKYERGMVLPAAETLVKIAECFDVSLDYLLSHNSSKVSSVTIRDKSLLNAFEATDQMDEDDRHVVKSLLDAFVKKKQLAQFLKTNSYV